MPNNSRPETPHLSYQRTPRRSRSSLMAGAALVLALAATGCGSSGDESVTTTSLPASSAPGATTVPGVTSTATSTDAGPDDGTVTINRSRFGPLELTVAVGDTVTFENTDPFAHTVTARDDSALQFDSGSMAQDATFDVTFDQAGTFAYFCEIHPTMRATVTAQ